MNIYLHVESVPRELDSKLLLAIIASAKGHKVLVSSIGGIIRGMKSGALAPGIFHTKSLTPGERKIAKHQAIIDNGNIITSIDEEGGLVDHGYEKFAKTRYSDQTIGQSSAVFSWGSEDVETLKNLYPKHSSKIYKTGSPRADLWKSSFSNYWSSPEGKPDKPYLLISSNMSYTNNVNQLYEIIANHKRSGYYDRDPEKIYKDFGLLSEESQLISEFIRAIKHLASNNTGYEIVLRPYLNEKVEAWKVLLEDIPNVHVIREGPINAWVNHAFAVMHNGCTTAIEATISGKPVVTYIPFKQKYAREIPNELGHIAKSPEELVLKVNSIFKDNIKRNTIKTSNQIPKTLSKKIYLDNEELAAEKIVKVWEIFEKKDLSKSCNWVILKFILRLMNLKDIFVIILKKLSPKKFGFYKSNHKFPPLDKKDVLNRIKKFQEILGIDVKLKCIFIGNRTILIKKL